MKPENSSSYVCGSPDAVYVDEYALWEIKSPSVYVIDDFKFYANNLLDVLRIRDPHEPNPRKITNKPQRRAKAKAQRKARRINRSK